MANKDLVYLVNAGNDTGMSSIANDHSFPALGVLALGTWLKEYVPDVEVVVRDGGVVGNEEIVQEIERIKPGIVGVSVLSTSYQNSLEIALHAKELGAHTIFGNDQASQLSRKILEKRPYVDFVVGSEYGEKSLELLVRSLRGEAIGFDEIPDLTFRTNGDIAGFDYEKDKGLLSIVSSPLYKTKSRKTALDIFPVVDRTLFPTETHWKKYLENYMDRFSGLHEGEEVTGVTTMNRARGCSRAKDPCSFCDMLLDVSFSSPEKFWEEVQEAYKQVGANVFYEVCDSFSSFPGLIDGIVRTKPDLDFDPKFFVYAQAIDLVRKPELVEQFKQMGVFRVNIGLEAGSDRTLQHMKGRYDSVDTNYGALQMLHNAGIHVYGSFVLGSDEETPETLRETVGWAKKIMREELIADVEAQPLLPLPQNRQGRKLQASGLLPAEMQNTDWPWDTDRIAQIYIDNFSGVTYQDVLSAAREIRDCAKEHRLNYGSGVSREEKYFKR
jgi:radical SAM superfamily enzyme YgiQ (UPF0313 family)